MEDSQMSGEKLTTQRKLECETRATKIVEFLIEGKLQPEVFLRCLKHINKSYYQDVVEERAISKVCGYSLCGNKIPTMPSKQFFIDTHCNKVYDITDRKNYCSNVCYRASVHIKFQIDDGPLWLRKLDDTLKFNLLDASERGKPGEEVYHGIVSSVEKESFISISSFAEIALEDINRDEVKSSIRHHHKVDKKEMLQTLNEMDELSETVITSPSVDFQNKPLRQNTKIKSSKQIKKSQKHQKSKKDINSILENIRQYVHEWMTVETYIFLYGEEQIKHCMDKNNLEQYFSNLNISDSNVNQQKKYLEICKKLHINQLIDESFDKSVLGFQINPVPDYKELQQDSHNLELKVRSFYNGSSYEVQEIQPQDNSSTPGYQHKEDGPSDNPALLPLVDFNSQNALRRKIYLNSINKAMITLTKNLRISSYHVLEELNLLVKSFKLQAHNVVFEPFVWSLIALILIKMLSIRSDNLKMQLDCTQSKIFIRAMLKQLPNADTFFQELHEGIQDIDSFLKQYFCDVTN